MKLRKRCKLMTFLLAVAQKVAVDLASALIIKAIKKVLDCIGKKDL